MSAEEHDVSKSEFGRKPAGDGEGGASVQSAVLEFLSEGAAFGQVPDRHIETHISHVFLVGEHAYKLKRSVRLNFLDYTSLQARHEACEREIRINRRTAPEIYIGVSSVTRCGDSFELDGDGEVVDYLVLMNRFDEATLFDRLCEDGELKPNLIEDLSEQIVKLHLTAEMRSDFGGASSVQKTIEGVSRTLTEFDGTILPTGRAPNWSLQMEAELLRQTNRIDKRKSLGFVRECHGDLHLGNICMINGRPTPFDAIEFGDEYSVIDVMYDLAFPVMDLVSRQRRDLANLLLNRYLEATSDYSGLNLLSLFIGLRSGVRAMVHALESGPNNTPNENENHRLLALNYLDHADTCLQPSVPRLVAVGGLSGSGKSTLARSLATRFPDYVGATVIRTDALRKHIFHRPALVPLPPEAYSDTANWRVFRAVCRNAHRALMAGYSVVVDATLIDQTQREELQALAERRNIRFDGLWLEAPAEVLIERVETRQGDVSDADRDVVQKQIERDTGPLSWTRLSASESPVETLEAACRSLGLSGM